MTDTETLQELIDVVAKLRSPDGGCPWDLAQTPQTLTPYVIEEAYEVVDAIKSGDQGASSFGSNTQIDRSNRLYLSVECG